MKTFLISIFCVIVAAGAFADPQITSWFTADSSQFAQIYRTDADKYSSQAETTWSNGRQIQWQPAFDGVQEILSSANWIYIRSTGLGSQIMGPWYNDSQHRFLFPNLPTDQHFIIAIPRHPTVQTTHHFSHLGKIGLFVDGVQMFDASDSFSYSSENGRDANPRAGIGRGDHVDFDNSIKSYSESATAPAKHSPILGWMDDGYPVYGPYGYSDPMNPNSGVRRMVSGFVLRNGENGADNLSETGRRTLPAWDARDLNRSADLQDYEIGPDVSDRYPLGHYLEDYVYLGDLGKTQGKDFDLDECNGRWCVTPEFPRGTFAYFTTIDANGRPVYPYIMGHRFHGNPVGRIVRAVYEPVTTNFLNQANTALSSATSAKTTTLTWNSINGNYDAGSR